MEERKQKEIQYYDEKAEELMSQGSLAGKEGDFEGFLPKDLSSFSFCYKLLEENCKGKRVLDYGCGNGVHTSFLIGTGAEKVIAIDLSEKSLEIAREKNGAEGSKGKVEFLAMDCEKTDFPDNYFDVIFDGGTFSSLDLNRAIPELARILKPSGFLIGIETFGHNPLTNLKRKINKATGKRTGWAAEHIFRKEDLEMVKSYFNDIDMKYFHLISWAAFPFLGKSFGKTFLKLLELADKIFLSAPFLKKYAFKVVFKFSNPQKHA